MTPDLKIKRLHPDAKMPVYASEGAACFDLHSVEDAQLWPGIPFHVFSTGIAFDIPPGWALKVFSRSGHGFHYNVRLANGTGIIDSDYRGEVLVKLIMDGNDLFTVRKGDRIAQAMLEPAPQVNLVEVDDLGDTARGTGGFGSTGA